MPDGSAWNLVDYVPGLDAELTKRGGWAYGSNDINAVTSTASYVYAVFYAPFSGGAQLVALDEDATLYKINIATLVVTNVGAATSKPRQLGFHRNKLVIPGDGSTVPRKYDGSSISSLTGAPEGQYVTAYRDRTVLAGKTSLPTYIYFSAAGDPTTWDTTNTWVSVNQPVTGLASLPGALMVFQNTVTSRIRGSTPPPQTDMILDDPLFNVGCTDVRSIAVTSSVCAFANPLGVYLTNGTNLPTDLTEAAGIKRYWQSVLVGYDASMWTLAGGFYQNSYVIAVMNGATFKDAFVFDLRSYSVRRLSNFQALCFANGTAISEELWFGLRSGLPGSEVRLGKFSTTFLPSSTVKNDANGTAVAPVVELPIYGAQPAGKKTWRAVYIEYDCEDAATDNPTLTVSYIKDQDDAYTALSPALVEATTKTRSRLAVRLPSSALGLKIAQTNASASTRIHSIQADVHAREGSRL